MKGSIGQVHDGPWRSISLRQSQDMEDCDSNVKGLNDKGYKLMDWKKKNKYTSVWPTKRKEENLTDLNKVGFILWRIHDKYMKKGNM